MKSANWWMGAVAALAMGWGASAWGASGGELVLGRQGSWRVIQTDGGTVKSLFLARDGSDEWTRLASVEVTSATVTNVYWDEFAEWNAQSGESVGGMVTNVETIAGEFTFRAFVNDGAVYWEDRADGVARLWTALCKAPEGKTLLAEGDAGEAWEMSTFDAEPWNRGAAWREAGPDGGTMAVFEDGATTRLSVKEAVAAKRNAGRKGVEAYETDYGYWTSWGWKPPGSSWQSEFHDQQSVAIPDGVTKIGMGVFGNCSKLTAVTIPDSVKTIETGAFYGCSGLGSVTIPDSVESIEDGAFQNCSGLTNLVVGEGVTRIGNFAFGSCRSLESVTILGNVTSGWYYDSSHQFCPFNGCTNLSKVILGDKMTKIGSYMFYGCSALTSVAIPDGVTDIGSRVFSGCNRLVSLEVPGDWFGTDILSGAGVPEGCTVTYRGLHNNPDEGPWIYLVKGGEVTVKGVNPAEGDLSIPAKLDGYPVTRIAAGAFYGCSTLTSVTIPKGVTDIGSNAFYECSALTNVTIPDSVKSIGCDAFGNCPSALFDTNSIPGVRLVDGWVVGHQGFSGALGSSGIRGIAAGAFADCYGLTSMTIPAGTTSIGARTFSYCGTLTNVTIPSSVTSIGESAFSGCNSLTDFVIPNSVTNVGNYAFSGCSSLLIVMIPNSVASIGERAFSSCSGLTWIKLPDGLASIAGGTFSYCVALTNVMMPNTVTSIGYRAFSDCTNLTSVTMPDRVTSIESEAFYNCSGLTHVAIPDGVRSLGYATFSGCSGLRSVTMPDSMTSIGGRAFSDCRGLTNVVIPDGVTSIGSSAFSCCNGLRSVTIPDRVKSIGDYAFYECTALTNVTIGNGVTSIGNSAFSACAGLANVTIGNRVTSIGSSAFSGCSGLTGVTIPPSVTSIGKGAFNGCSGLTSVTILGNVMNDWAYDNYGVWASQSPFANCTNIATLILGDKITKIGACMFYGCSGLTRVTIPASVTSIGKGAFNGCNGLTCVTILGNVTNDWLYCDDYGAWASQSPFEDCTNIATLVLGDKITKIGACMFYGCSGLTHVTIPASVTSIGKGAFNGCNGLTSVTIPDSVTSIGDRAFCACNNLTSLTIRGNVTNDWYWEDYENWTSPFANCTNIATLVLGDKTTKIGACMFFGCSGLTSVTIPDSVTSIGWWAFEDCRGLTSVTIGNGVTSIGDDAFYGCNGLTNISVAAGNSQYSSANGLLLNKEGTTVLLGVNGDVEIPGSVTSIGEEAFRYCSGLTSVTIPDSVTSIGRFAFGYCSGLASMTIGNGVTSIGDYAFDGCSGRTNISVAAGNPRYSSANGLLLDKEGTTVLMGVSGDVTIPASVTFIGGSAFSGCSGLTSVAIPDGVTRIGGGAFSGCSGLTSVAMPDSVTYIGGSAFSGCSGLTSVTIPDSVTSIGDYAFEGCSGLTRVTIGDSVASIGSGAFAQCSDLYDTNTISGVSLVDGWVVGWTESLSGTLNLTGIRGIVNSAFDSCYGLTSVTIGNGVTSIGRDAFHGCGNLTSVTIPDSVTSIGHCAFYYCSGLTSVTIPDRVTSIGDQAFRCCSGLTSVTIPGSVTSIETWAFDHCSGLKVLYVPSDWDATTVLKNAGVPSGCAIVAYDATEEVKATGGAVAVPQAWLAKKAGKILAGTEGCCDYEAAAKAEAANGMRVWECYLAGLEPEDARAVFAVKSIEFVDGKPVVKWAPDLNDGGTRQARAYRVWARKSIEKAEPEGDGTREGWRDVTGQEESWVEEGWRFFKVEVEMPQEGVAEQTAQTISFALVGAQTTQDRVTLFATATSGGEVTFEVVSGPGVIAGNVLSFTGAGTVEVRAVQAGDDLWLPATATQTVTVEKAAQTISFAVIGPQKATNRVELSATATSGGAVLFNVMSGPGRVEGNVLTFTGAGTVVVRAEQAGNDLWKPAVATQTVSVEKAEQTISFASIGNPTASSQVALSATATSGKTVTFEVVSGPGKIAGNVLTFTGVGTVEVRAVQAGDDLWLPATATQTVKVSGGNPSIVIRWENSGFLSGADYATYATQDSSELVWMLVYTRNGFIAPPEMSGATGEVLVGTDMVLSVRRWTQGSDNVIVTDLVPSSTPSASPLKMDLEYACLDDWENACYRNPEFPYSGGGIYSIVVQYMPDGTAYYATTDLKQNINWNNTNGVPDEVNFDMDDDVQIANYLEQQQPPTLDHRFIYISSDIAGGTVTANKAYAEEGELVTLTVTPNPGMKLTGLWANGKAIEGTSFVMPPHSGGPDDYNVTITAEFAPDGT